MVVIGIDPGKNGAVARIDENGIAVELITHVRTWLRECGEMPEKCHIILEKAQSMPQQGIVSAFNYGVGFGRILEAIEIYGLPHTLVTPRDWTKEMHRGCTGKDAKAKSLQAAQRLFPGVDFKVEGCRVPHDGIVDALLIAEFGRRCVVK